MAIQYNALDYAQQLEAAGVPKAQAAVHAKTLGHVISDWAVPADLYAMKDDLTHELRETETRLRSEIAIASANLRTEIASTSANPRTEIANTAAGLRADIREVEGRLLTAIHSTESRLISKMEIGDAYLAGRIDKLENALTYLKWMNGVTLAILVGFIVKSSLV
jgi:hypothetical protein